MLIRNAACRGAGAAQPVLGAEIWPQPTFAAATGLTLTASSIAGSVWSSDGSGVAASCLMSAPPVIAQGEQYKYTVTYNRDVPASNVYVLQIGDKTVALIGSGTVTGFVTIGAGPPQVVGLQDDNSSGAIDYSNAVSVKKVIG